MPPKRTKSRHPSNPSVGSGMADGEAVGGGVAACEDIMLCILTRLPVKSIMRFKSVCKPWLHLLSTAEFMKLHQANFSSDPSESFLIHRINKNGSNTISFFDIDSNKKTATILGHPFIYDSVEIVIVGCCKGLVCIGRGNKEIVLWNPALNLFKTVLPPALDPEFNTYLENTSLGFGYDAEADDFKVVRIVSLMFWSLKGNQVEVYSVNSGSWTKIEPNLQLVQLWNPSDVTVNGNPYWVVKDDDGKKVLVCFHMKKLIFNFVSLSTLDYDEESAKLEFIDCNGSISALVYTWDNEEERVSYVDVWVFDDGEQIWRRKQRVGPIEVKVGRVLRCLEDGRVLAKRPKGQLILFNPETRSCVKSLFNVAPKGEDFKIYGYAQSVAHIEGMEKAKPRRRAIEQLH